MFLNLKGVGAPFRWYVSAKRGTWLETGLGRPFWWDFGDFSSHCFVKQVLLQDASSLKFDHVCCRFVNGRSISENCEIHS